MSFIKKHPVASVSIAVLAVAAIVSGVSFGTYSAEYNTKVAKINADRERLKAKLPQLPEEVFIDNGYFTYDDTEKTVSNTKSAFKGAYVYEAEAATIALNDATAPASYVDVAGTAWKTIAGLEKKGGNVTFTITTTSYGLSDIDIVLASCWKNAKGEMQAISNISDYIKIEMNGLLVKTEECEIPDDGSYQHLILKNTHLIEGNNTLTIKTAVYNTLGGTDLYVMPNIRNVAVATDVSVTIPE
ncbi:MAG: hypothetical protein MJ228_02190 [Bacilli bacterium]|nr:hypothetical protein [Bacilli bacterium]